MKRTLSAAGAVALAISLLTITASHAQTPSPSPSPTPAPVAIKAGRLLDVKTGKVATNVFISIDNHRIKSIGNEAPAGVRVIDLSSAFVMAGMVDCHAHILGDLADLSPGSSFRMSSAKKTLWGMKNLKV
jgi:imidazolonepropionase-like amidohydrolase